MKVIVMGGAGDMGSKTVEDLASSKDVKQVTIADRDAQGARAIADKLSDTPVDIAVVPVDATDHEALVEAIKGHDVVASALGPLYLFEARLIQAALEAGVDYVSICDDWSAAQDTIIRFDTAAREENLFVITGCGVSPGVSNVGVRLLADRLDRARKADIYVYIPIESGEGEAVVKHTLFVFGTVVPVLKHGTVSMLPAGSISRRVEFPKFGVFKVWNIGHGEPVTIPKYIPELEEVNIMMGMGRGTEIFVALGRLGMLRSPKQIDLMSRVLMKLSPSKPGPAPEGAMRLDVSGEKDGEETTLTLCGTGTMREATGIALSIGAQLLGKKKLAVKSGGVYGPERCFDPEVFLKMIGEKGIFAYSDLSMTERIG